MNLSPQQINNLITGTGLAAELPASAVEFRRFVAVRGYELNDRGRPCRLSKTISSEKIRNVLFEIRDYEIPSAYIEKGWDVTEDYCAKYSCVAGIVGIAATEAELAKHLPDFSLLVPEWECDSPL